MKNELPKRKNIRIPKYDYSQIGMYFITICTENRRKILSDIVLENATYMQMGKKVIGESVKLNLTNIGNLINEKYINIENEFKNVKLHDYLIMPNHIHGIIEIVERVDTGPTPTISDIICSFKTRTTHEISIGVKERKYKKYQKRFWQRNYYEHVI